MILSHNRKKPTIHPSAWVAPTATVCGDVSIGKDARVAHGATLIAEGGRIELGERCIVLQNAVIRSTARHSTSIGSFCLVGPNAHLVGCRLDDEVFVATGTSVFHGAHLESGVEVRIRGTVHLRTRVPAGRTVPIGWVAVGDPAEIFSPDKHEEIWAHQKPLNFPMTSYGLEREEANMRRITERMAAALGSHMDDERL
ncbi:MAG: gamma carbonic anhydrase family protein [bacterium]|nr:gamma carbonic anhydrase family protein [bacterium]